MADPVDLARPEDVVPVLDDWLAARLPATCRRHPTPLLAVRCPERSDP